ncbi:hypothetical protein AAG747_08810 [Rapidithrix thailandica]|uniref:Alpha-L-rhamnosidase six-hairpin glycosidase domain-containing protein n=1 Tax=Rapidithrix thailandica TaxID=413964 RepID=A0AAW9S6G5_9BACT
MKKTISILIGLFLFFQACQPSEQQKSSREVFDTQEIDAALSGMKNRWKEQGDAIVWEVKDSHTDHLEFSGRKVSAVVYYGADSTGQLVLHRRVVWPMLRTIPNDTHASSIHDFDSEINPILRINGEELHREQPFEVSFNGILTLRSETGKHLEIQRQLSPSTHLPVIVEKITYKNTGASSMDLEIAPVYQQVETAEEKGVSGAYVFEVRSDTSGVFSLQPGESCRVGIQIAGRKVSTAPLKVGVEQELRLREGYLRSLQNKLVLECPDPVLNQMFAFAKIRAAESIFETQGGLMHGPGGTRYYAAIWANDQAEYINPFFPFLGDSTGNASAMNSFRHFARFMNDEFKPIPSSIVAEGTDIWNGAGDRGDMAMIAYGASRFALEMGHPEIAEELWPLINWCLEYLERKKTPEGVYASDTDELENRFPAGKANLSTAMLTYGALRSTTYLCEELGKKEEAGIFAQRADQLRTDIEAYFGAEVQGYATYRYFEGNDKLRSWICIPLTMGMFERKDETIRALLSPHLWSKDGVYTEAGSDTFWDRSTLYAFRGIFAAGEVETALKYFKYYSQKRLLGEHVPYAVEAWPEGNQRHLSAESGLYCRVVTEGLFGIEPTGFQQFSCLPRLPEAWPQMQLKQVQAFGRSFDINVFRDGEKVKVAVTADGDTKVKEVKDNTPVMVDLSNLGN